MRVLILSLALALMLALTFMCSAIAFVCWDPNWFLRIGLWGGPTRLLVFAVGVGCWGGLHHHALSLSGGAQMKNQAKRIQECFEGCRKCQPPTPVTTTRVSE
jgi:hypothetical protein